MTNQRNYLKSSTKAAEPGHQKPATPTIPVPVPVPEAPKPFNLLGLPSELRMIVHSHVVQDAAGPLGTVRINPQALSCVEDGFLGHHWVHFRHKEASKLPTRRHARQGVLQACQALRREALEVLYNRHTFFAHMCHLERFIRGGSPSRFYQERFTRWLAAMGSDLEARRIKSVVFAVAWNVGRWKMDRVLVGVSIIRGKVRFYATRQEGELAEAKVEVVKRIERLLIGRDKGGGLDREEWGVVWDTVVQVMSRAGERRS